jgi:RNA polymerase sigma-70 factor (ECF subfamily)
VDDRRGFTAIASEVPLLPKKVRRHAGELVFVERIEPSAEQVRDADSKRLVIRYQQGDESVFGELYLRYFNSVYAYARVALSDHHEAEDVTQQVFMRALGALGRFELRPNVPFRSWLFSIARNLVVTAVKGRSDVILDSPEQIDTLRESEPENAQDVADTLGWLTDREVAFFVERLPLAQRQALVLRFMLDLPSHEIARILGRSPTGVRKLQSRALKSLEARLTAVGRRSPRYGPTPTRRRLKPLPVLRERRFALVHAYRRSRSAA